MVSTENTSPRTASATRRITLGIALVLFAGACGSNLAVESRAPQERYRSIARFEAFVIGLGEIFNSTRVDDPESVRKTLQVTLSEQPTKMPGFQFYSVSGLPASITQGTYNVHLLKDGRTNGTLRLWIDTSISCLTMARLIELTRIEFRRSPIFQHNQDLTKMEVSEHYASSITNLNKLRTVFSVELGKKVCIGLIVLVG